MLATQLHFHNLEVLPLESSEKSLHFLATDSEIVIGYFEAAHLENVWNSSGKYQAHLHDQA